jgi:predicted nucleic acid-binding protein
MTASGPVTPEVVLDASVWVSRELATDVNHQAARAWVNQHLQAGGSFVEPAWLLVEVAAAISRQVGPPEAQTALGLLARLRRRRVIRFVPMTPALLREVVDIAGSHGLRAGDAVYVALSRQLALPLVSFDADQLQRAAGLVPTLRP